MIDDLHKLLSDVVEETDRSLDYLSENGFQKMTRDELVIDVQAWHVMFSDNGKAFTDKNPSPAKSTQDLADWFRDHYPFDVRRDPISAWIDYLAEFAKEENEHTALKKYQDFMLRTEGFRQGLSSAVDAVDEELAHPFHAEME